MREGYRQQQRLGVRLGRRPEIDTAQGEQPLGRAVRVGTQQIPASLQLAHIETLGQAVAGLVEQGIKRQQVQHAVGRNIKPVETSEIIAELAKQLFVQRLRGRPAGTPSTSARIVSICSGVCATGPRSSTRMLSRVSSSPAQCGAPKLMGAKAIGRYCRISSSAVRSGRIC